MILDKIREKGESMAVLEGMDRLQYIIDEAKSVAPLGAEHKTEENKIRGCISWRFGRISDGTPLPPAPSDTYQWSGEVPWFWAHTQGDTHWKTDTWRSMAQCSVLIPREKPIGKTTHR